MCQFVLCKGRQLNNKNKIHHTYMITKMSKSSKKATEWSFRLDTHTHTLNIKPYKSEGGGARARGDLRLKGKQLLEVHGADAELSTRV